MNNERTLWNRFRYWFDNQMSRGSLTLIKLLTVVTLIIVLLVAGLVLLTPAGQEMGPLGTLWESFSTIINAWMPSAEDGDGSLPYLVLMAVAAMSGLLITSVLIGIISSAIEEKITSLKQGNSLVMEEGHTIILGFEPGEFTLLEQLIVAAGEDPSCIVVAGALPRDEMEESIRGNVEIPNNIRIICRTVDIYDAASLERCAIGAARSIILRPGRDVDTVKTLLALTQLLDPEAERHPSICAIVAQKSHMLPQSFREKHHIIQLYSGDAIAKVIARAGTQPGISGAFEEILNFEGFDLYVVSVPEAVGLTFAQLSLRMENAVPMGIFRGERCLLNPEGSALIGPEDLLLLFTPGEHSFFLQEENSRIRKPVLTKPVFQPSGQVGIVGVNRELTTVISELPEDVSHILIADDPENLLDSILSELEEPLREKIQRFPDKVNVVAHLERFAVQCDHILVMSNGHETEEMADFHSMLRLLQLRDIRERLGLTFNITAELLRENNQQLVSVDDTIDFVVASNISSLFLVQLAEEPRLYRVFRELLSSQGNELYIRTASELRCTHPTTLAQLRAIAAAEGYLLLGWMPAGEQGIRFDMKLNETLPLTEADRFVVLGEE